MGDDRLGQSLYRAARKNPDESAKIIQISDSQGLPTDTVERNRVETEARHKYGNISASELRKASPITAEFLANEDNASVSIDDVPVLQGIEAALTDSATPWYEVLRRSFNAGTLGLAKSASEIIGQTYIGSRYPIADYMDDRERAEYKSVISSSSVSRLRNELAQLNTLEEKQALRDKYADIIENPLTPKQSARRAQDIRSDPDIASQRNISASLDQQASEMRIKTDRFTPRGVISAAIESVTHMVPGLALGALTGTGSIALGSIAAHVYGQELHYGREVLGLDENTNLGRAFTMASTETLAETLPVMAFLGKSGADTALRQWLRGTFGEAGEEVITELVQGGLDKGIYEKDANMDKVFDWLFSLEGLADLGFSGLVGTLVGSVLVAPSASIQAINSRIEKNATRVIVSANEQVVLDKIISLAQASRTRGRAQDRFQSFLRAAGKDGAVYISAAEINNLIAQGVELPQYITEQAINVDHDVMIPMDRFASEIAVDKELLTALRPHVRLTPDNLAATDLEAGTEESVKRLLEAASKAADLKTEADEIYEQVKDQLVGTGRQSEETARWSALVIPAYVTVKAEQLGITPTQVYRHLGLRVIGPYIPLKDRDAQDEIQRLPATWRPEVPLYVQNRGQKGHGGSMLNVGHTVGDKANAVDPTELAAAIEALPRGRGRGVKVLSHDQIQSDTTSEELTSVIVTDRLLTSDEIHKLSEQFGQQAIAHVNLRTGKGDLSGPGRESWIESYGPFNPEFFYDERGQAFTNSQLQEMGLQDDERGQTLTQQRTELTEPPVTPQGEIELIHFGLTEGRTLIDPAFYGSNAAGAERELSMRPDWINRSYWGVATGQPGGYKKEARVGTFQSKVMVPADKLYDYQGNPDNLPQKSITAYETEIKNAGYLGYWSKHPKLGMAAAVFESLEASPAQRYDRTLAQQAKRNEIGLYSGVEQAVLDMRLPEWNTPEGTAKGKVIWQKLQPGKARGVGMKELKYLGLEEWLLSGTRSTVLDFTRQDVVDFIRKNGVYVEEVIAQEESETELDEWDVEEVDWSQGVADENPANWESEVDTALYDYDQGDARWFNLDEWLERNWDAPFLDDLAFEGKGARDAVVEERKDIDITYRVVEEDGKFFVEAMDVDYVIQRSPPHDTRERALARKNSGSLPTDKLTYTRTVTKAVPDAEIQKMIDDKDIDALKELDGFEDKLRAAARDDFEEEARVHAEQWYYQNPYRTYTAGNVDEDLQIWGNDEIGFRITLNGNPVGDSDIWSIEEAQIQAGTYMSADGRVVRRVVRDTKWHDLKYRAPGESSNYREQKLLLPDIENKFYHRVHFDEPNLVAFNRLTDRMTKIGKRILKALHIEETQSDWDSQARKLGGYNMGLDVSALEDESAMIQGQINELLQSKFKVDEEQLPRELTRDEAKEVIDNNEMIFVVDERGFDYPGRTVRRIENTERLPDVNEPGITYYESNPDGTGSEVYQLNAFRKVAWDIIRGNFAGEDEGVANRLIYRRIKPLIEELKPLVAEYDERQKVIDAEKHGPPDQPYKSNAWLNLSIKYAINEAIKGGYDQLSWNDNATIQGTWSPHYNYEAQYNRKMVSKFKQLTGQQPRHVTLDGDPITPAKKLTWKEAHDRLAETGASWIPARSPVYIENTTRPGRTTSYRWQKYKAIDYRFQLPDSTDNPILWDGNPNEAPKGKFVIDINDAVKETWGEGPTLFQDERRGQDQDERRGELELVNNERILKMREASDLSTFLHEGAHLFLEAEKQFAKQYGLTDDHTAIMNWLGIQSLDEITPASPHEDFTDDQKALHEKFARAFEAYLMEGKAPSVELRAAFGTFKHWLLEIYKNWQSYFEGVELNDEIRGVFDRMLATQSEIEQALATPAYDQYFRSKEQAGMTDDEWEKYQKAVQARKDRATSTVDEKVMAEYRKRRTAEWDEERRVLIEDYTESLKERPVYKLLDELLVKPMNRKVVKDILKIDSIPRSLYGRTKIGDNTANPDHYAEKYVYPSSYHMLRNIVTTPSLKKAAFDAAESSMIEKYGDILNDGTLEADVQEALHNDAQAEILLSELKAVGRPINREYLKTEAQQLIGTMTYREIQPNKFLRAEIRAAKRAVTDEDPTDAKIQQLVNHYLYREAVATRKAMERHRRYVKQVQTRQYDNKSVDPAYIQNMKVLANLYDMTSPQAQQADVNSLLNWYLSQINDKNQFVEIQLLDPNLVLALKAKQDGEIPNLVMPKFDDLVASDLRGVYEMLRHLRFVGGQVADQQSNEVKAERIELTESLISNGGRDTKDPKTGGRKPSEWDAVKHFFNKLVSLRNLIRKLDGNFAGEDEGVANRLIYRRIEDATNDRLDLATTMYDRFKDELDGIHKIGLSSARRKDVSIELESGESVVLNPEEMFMMALYWGTESSREAIREGHGMTDNDVATALSKLTVEQLKMVNAVWKINESTWSELSAASVKRYGVAPEKLDATPFEVNGVEMTGGHMRLFYNSLELELQEEQRRGEQYATIIPTKAGSLYERVGSGGRPVLLDRNNIVRAMEDNLHFIAFAETGQRIRRIVNATSVRESIQRKHGVPFHQALIEQLDMLIRNKKERDTWPLIAKITRLLRRAATYRHLIGSVRNIVQQISSLPIAADEVGTVNLANAYMTFVSDGGASMEMILERSAFMRNRSSFVNREAAEYLRQLSVDNQFQYIYGKFAEVGFAPQTFIDSLIAFPTWLAKYELGMTDHGDERRAISDADVAVGESVGSGADIHLGGAFNSNAPEYIRTLTVFGSWFNAYYQRMYRHTKGFSTTTMTPAGFRAVLTTPLIVAPLAAILVMDYPDDDSDEGWAEYVAKRYVAFMAGTLPLIRDMVGFAVSGYAPKTVLAGGQEGPWRAAEEARAFFEGRQSALKTASDITKAVTTIVPVPASGQVTRVADYLDSYWMGKEGDFNAYQMLVEGPDKNR